MNSNNAKGKLCVLVKCAAILLISILVSCEQPKPVKVVDSIDAVLTKETSFVIRHIEPNGLVLLGRKGMSPKDCRFAAAELEWPTYWLEGKAAVNDPVIIVLRYKIQTLESGEMREADYRWTVRSRYNQKYQDVFPTTSTGEKVSPGTQ